METVKAIVSYIHIISAAVALIFGAIILIKRKGNKKHRELGAYYFYIMISNNVTALFIYNAFGKWFFPHTLAVVALFFCFLGLFAVKKNWIKTHITSFVASYYLLIGGAINEAFLRIKFFTSSQETFGIVHFIAMLFFIGLIISYLIKYKQLIKN